MEKNWCQELSTYRLELFGIAALGIMMGHSNQIPNLVSGKIASIMSWGGVVGVYIFILLSGIGLYYSYTNNSGIVLFYKRRLKKVLVPYIFICGLWYLIKCIFFEKSILLFFYEISFMSFWLEHRGAWFIAFLIPVYIVYPFFYSFIERNVKTRNVKIVCTLLIVLFIEILVERNSIELYNHLMQIFASLIVFIIGHYLGKYIKNNIAIRQEFFLIPLLTLFVWGIGSILNFYKAITFTCYAISCIGMAIVCARILSILKCKKINGMLCFFGRISLEMYLLSLVCFQFLKYVPVTQPVILVFIFIIIIEVVIGNLCPWVNR